MHPPGSTASITWVHNYFREKEEIRGPGRRGGVHVLSFEKKEVKILLKRKRQ